MTTKTDTNTDPPTEERIEEMLEIEHDLREQYDDQLIDTGDPKADDDGPADSRLDEYTGRVIDFERVELAESVKQTRAGSKIKLRILCHDGETRTETVQWPFDPTDKEEPLVRLCAYVDVQIDRVAELQGEYVPMESEHSLDIPPIPTRGNRLAYGVRRFFRTHPRLQKYLRRGGSVVAAFLWLPAIFQLHRYAVEYPDTVPVHIFLLAMGLTFGAMGSAAFLILRGLPWLSTQKGRFFPKP